MKQLSWIFRRIRRDGVFTTIKHYVAKIRTYINSCCQKTRDNFPKWKRKVSINLLNKTDSEAVLVAGPFVGELGWEIGVWVPHIKGLTEILQCKTHVFTRKGHESLYPFAESIETFDFPNQDIIGNWLANPPEYILSLYENLEQEVRQCADQLKMSGKTVIVEISDSNKRQTEFADGAALLLSPEPAVLEKWADILPQGPKVVLVFRAYARGGEHRNSDISVLKKIANFLVKTGCTPIIIGKTSQDYEIPKLPGQNLINQTSLTDLIAIYKLSSAVVGVSTGTIHLAAACGVPHITWGSTFSDDTVIKRYNQTWNLNGTWVRFLTKDWQCNINEITKSLSEALNKTED